MAFDRVLLGGSVIDGSGTPARREDVGLAGGRISAVGDLRDTEARVTLDCTGKTVTPGFIDIHSHSDWLLPGVDHARLVEPFVRQGMTTLVGGNCGFSPAPVTAANRRAATEASRLIVDDVLDLRWETMAEFLDVLDDASPALNIAQLVGHGAVRAAVCGPLDPAEPDAGQLADMERLVREALDAGCFGVSTGLGYAPGIFAGHDELAAFARWAAASDRLFTSHLRAYSRMSGVYQSDANELAHNLRAIDEMLEVADDAGARLQISHLIFVGRRTWPTHVDALARIEAARERGLDVAFDAFPYTAGNTTAAVLFPPEVLPELEKILSSPDDMAALRAFADAAFAEVGFDLTDIQIMRANAAEFDDYDGLFVGEAAERAGMDIWDFYARLVVESHRNARVLIHRYSGDDDDETALRAVLAHPLCTIETDTFVTEHGHQNPASFGTFPRVLATYVEAGLFTLEEAVRKMTGAAAERLGLTDRGCIEPGAAADLVVLHGDRLRDTATFASPASAPVGIEHVFINGHHVIDGPRYHSGLAPGRVLRA